MEAVKTGKRNVMLACLLFSASLKNGLFEINNIFKMWYAFNLCLNEINIIIPLKSSCTCILVNLAYFPLLFFSILTTLLELKITYNISRLYDVAYCSSAISLYSMLQYKTIWKCIYTEFYILLWTKMCPLKIHTEALTPQCDCIWDYLLRCSGVCRRQIHFLPIQTDVLVGAKSQFYYKYPDTAGKLSLLAWVMFMPSICEWVNINNFLHIK